MGGQPTRNYTEGTFEQCKDIDGSTLAKTILKERDTCYACVVKCKRVVEVHDPDLDIDPVYGGPEYETLTFFGSMCGVGDLKLLAKASADANMYGMDTISAGATIAWAMEAKAKGLLDDGGLGLAWGDGHAVLRAIEAIALRRGVGDLLAEGSLRAAKTLGQAAVDLTVTVKGQELPAHMPQHKRSLGLDLRGEPLRRRPPVLRARLDAPDQAGQPASPAARRAGRFGDLDLRDLSDEKVRFAYRTQCFYSALDSLGLCQFVWGPSWQLYGPSETVELVRVRHGVGRDDGGADRGRRAAHPSPARVQRARGHRQGRRRAAEEALPAARAARARRRAWRSPPRSSSTRAQTYYRARGVRPRHRLPDARQAR